jgi:hypothetical protein
VGAGGLKPAGYDLFYAQPLVVPQLLHL